MPTRKTKTTKKAPEAESSGQPSVTYTVNLSNGVTKQVTRRKRVPISKEIRQRLEEIFTTQQLPRGRAGTEYLHTLSKDTGLTYKQLRKWFDNRTQKKHLHEARALAVLSGKTEDLARPRQAYQQKYSVNKKAKHFIPVSEGGTKTDRTPSKNGEKKGSGVGNSTKILDSIPSNSSARKSAVAYGNINVSDEVKGAMGALNEYFNKTEPSEIVGDNHREDCFLFIIDCLKKSDRGVFKLSKSILERYNETLYKALQTLFRNGSFEDLKIRIMHEKPSLKTSLVWHALCNFQNRNIDAIIRASVLMYDGCVDKNKAISSMVKQLIPEFSAKIALELQKRKDKERTKRKSSGKGGSSAKKAKAAGKSPKATKPKTPVQASSKVRNV